jgi:serine/threonine protein kinase
MVQQSQNSYKKTLCNFGLIQKIGDGCFGDAYSAINTDTNAKVCVKVFKNVDQNAQESFQTEISFAEKVNHPNVVKLLGAGRDVIRSANGNTSNDVLYIVSELCANGEAFDYVYDAGGLKPHYARRLFLQLCNGMQHLHDNDIAHRDMKLQNTFLDENCILKVADFGLAKCFGTETHR